MIKRGTSLNKTKISGIKQNVAAGNTSASGETISSGNYTSSGGVLNISGRTGGYVTSGGSLSFVLKIDGNTVYTFTQFVGTTNLHLSFPFNAVVSGIAPGSHTISLVNNGGTFTTDGNDKVDLVVIEIG